MRFWGRGTRVWPTDSQQLSKSGCGVHPCPLGALDHEPQHERNFPEEGGLGDGKRRALILRPQYANKAQGKVGEAAERQPRPETPAGNAICEQAPLTAGAILPEGSRR